MKENGNRPPRIIIIDRLLQNVKLMQLDSGPLPNAINPIYADPIP